MFELNYLQHFIKRDKWNHQIYNEIIKSRFDDFICLLFGLIIEFLAPIIIAHQLKDRPRNINFDVITSTMYRFHNNKDLELPNDWSVDKRVQGYVWAVVLWQHQQNRQLQTDSFGYGISSLEDHDISKYYFKLQIT